MTGKLFQLNARDVSRKLGNLGSHEGNGKEKRGR